MNKNILVVHVDMTEEQLAHLSPAAAETAKLIRGGKSLTDMIRLRIFNFSSFF